jgi:hypothetical protein
LRKSNSKPSIEASASASLFDCALCRALSAAAGLDREFAIPVRFPPRRATRELTKYACDAGDQVVAQRIRLGQSQSHVFEGERKHEAAGGVEPSAIMSPWVRCCRTSIPSVPTEACVDRAHAFAPARVPPRRRPLEQADRGGDRHCRDYREELSRAHHEKNRTRSLADLVRITETLALPHLDPRA